VQSSPHFGLHLKQKFVWLCLLFGGAAQWALAQSDPLAGTFHNAQLRLQVQIAKQPIGYSVGLEVAGQAYAGSGFRVGNLLSGGYQYQGQEVPFQVYPSGNQLVFASEGQEVPLASGPLPRPQPAELPGALLPAAGGDNAHDRPAPAAVGRRENSPQGFSFVVPSGWTCARQPNGSYLCSRGRNQEEFLGLDMHGYHDRDVFMRETRASVGENIRLLAPLAYYGQNGVSSVMGLSQNGQQANVAAVAIFSPYGGGVQVNAGNLNRAYRDEYLALAQSVASSIVFSRPTATTLTNQWQQRLNGKRLMFLQTGNGSSDKVTYDLCSQGTFVFGSNTSYLSGGFSAIGTDEDRGTWRLVQRGNVAYLLLQSPKSGARELELRARNAANEVSLGGQRYFLVPSERCR
jgi:hypothetical protein